MTLSQLILVLSGIWLFLVIGMYIAPRRENKRNLKIITDAHKSEQTTIDQDELASLPEPDDIDWAGLGLELCERPFVQLRDCGN